MSQQHRERRVSDRHGVTSPTFPPLPEPFEGEGIIGADKGREGHNGDAVNDDDDDVRKNKLPYPVPCYLDPGSPLDDPTEIADNDVSRRASQGDGPFAGTLRGPDGRGAGEDEHLMVDSLWGAFRAAEWPMWSTVLLGVLIAATAISILVLMVSRSWRQPPPALAFLRQSQCPLFLGYTENQQAPFTLWLPRCTLITTGHALACETDHDCVAVGAACASAAVRASMRCATASLGGVDLPASSAGAGALPWPLAPGSTASRDIVSQKYCMLSLPIESARGGDAADGTAVTSSLPFCLPDASSCALCRTPQCPDGRLVACVTGEMCRMETPWMCLT